MTGPTCSAPVGPAAAPSSPAAGCLPGSPAWAALVAAPPGCPRSSSPRWVHAELATLRPFVTGNGVVARALGRALVVGRGLDPTGVAVWEAALLAAGPRPTRWPWPGTPRAARTASGAGCDVRAAPSWTAPREGRRAADAVLAGRLDDPA